MDTLQSAWDQEAPGLKEGRKDFFSGRLIGLRFFIIWTRGIFMYIVAIVSTLAAWVIGLLLDANISFYPQGFLCLRILLPVLAMGLCILRSIKESKENQGK